MAEKLELEPIFPHQISPDEQTALIEILREGGENVEQAVENLIQGTLLFVRLSGCIDGFMLIAREDQTLWVWALTGTGLRGSINKLWEELQAFGQTHGFTSLGLKTKRPGLAKLLDQELGWKPKAFFFKENFDVAVEYEEQRSAQGNG